MSALVIDLKAHFYALADHVQRHLHAGEGFTLWFTGEQSDFVRFNHGRVRQAGNVTQGYLTLRLVAGQKHITQTYAVAGNQGDLALTTDVLGTLRVALSDVLDDPHLLLAEEVHSTEVVATNRLPATEEMVADIVDIAGGVDLVGFLASGPVYTGFANQHGQRNWFETVSWNFDWSLYSHGDKAVKRGSAGKAWNRAEIAASVAEARSQLALLAKPVRSLSPGAYRAYLTPAAVGELTRLLDWGGFSEKQIRTKRSALGKLVAGEALLSQQFSLVEDTLGGLAPNFQGDGFIKPEQVELIREGRMVGSLISPRTAKEYGIPTNGAGAQEGSESFSMAPGTLASADALKALGTGLYVSNLWYLNYSDQPACRMTGMTRFASFWVENGEIVAPLNVMRFDDSAYRMLGSELEALTVEQAFLADPLTVEARSRVSQRLSGALLKDWRLVL